ncbi:MAG TPA: hypothetical protein VGH93_00975, partial [Solirubrobacteraceae bacterium]
RVVETASNAGGSGTPATSAATTVVQVAAGTSGTLTVAHARVSGTSARVAISCSGGPGAVCDVTVTLTVTETIKHGTVIAVSAANRAKTKRRVVSLGTGSAALVAGQSTVIRVTLNRSGMRLLAQRGVLKTTLRVVQSGKTASRQTITFNKPKNKRH